MIFKAQRIIPAYNWLLKIMFRQSTITKAQEIKEMSLLEQKAYLATKTIHKIISPDIKLLKERSLSDQIVDMLRQQQAVGNVQTEARQAIEKLFTKGIQVDLSIFPQDRVIRGLSPKNTLFKFSPTHLVTGQIFNLILKQNSTNAIWIGHYGISKTISVMLFWHLSSIITEYNFKTYGLQKSKFKLKIESYLFQVPKLLYYSIDQQQSFSDIRQIMLKQTKTQLGTLKQQRLILPLNPQDKNWQISLKKTYLQKQIYSLLFIDQIHTLMSSWRQLKVSLSNQTLQKKIIQNFAKFLIEKGQTFYGVVLLSSVDVQQSIHQDFKFGSGRNHSRLDQKIVNYPELLPKTQSICQLVDIFIFQFGQYVKIPILQQNWYQYSKMADSGKQSFKSKIRTKLIHYLQSQKNQYFLTYLAINEEFKNLEQSTMQQFRNYKGEQDLKKLEDEIINLMKKLIKQSISMLKLKVKQFISKIQEQKQKNFVIWELTYNAKKEVLLNKSQGKYKVDIADIKLKKDILDRHLFHYQKYSESIYCLISPKILLQILQNQSKNSFLFILKFYRKYFLDKLTRSGLGGHFEILLIDILSSGNVSLKILEPFNLRFQLVKQKKQKFQSIPKDNNSEINQFGQSEEYKQLKKERQQVIRNQKEVKKQQQSGHESQIDKLEQKLEQRVCKIFSKRKNNWRFLDSLKSSFKEQTTRFFDQKQKGMYVKQKYDNHVGFGQCVVYLPVRFDEKLKQKLQKSEIINSILSRKKELTKNQLLNINKKFRQLTQIEDENSKCIDSMLVNFNHYQYKIRICAFDATISQKKFLEKFTNFIEEFLCFGDRNQKIVYINNIKYDIQLNYFVMSPPKTELKDIPKKLNQRFYGFLEFKAIGEENSTFIDIINKETNTQNDLILTKIGIIPVEKFQIIKGKGLSTQNIQIQMFKEVSQRALKESDAIQLIEEAAKFVQFKEYEK